MDAKTIKAKPAIDTAYRQQEYRIEPRGNINIVHVDDMISEERDTFVEHGTLAFDEHKTLESGDPKYKAKTIAVK